MDSYLDGASTRAEGQPEGRSVEVLVGPGGKYSEQRVLTSLFQPDETADAVRHVSISSGKPRASDKAM